MVLTGCGIICLQYKGAGSMEDGPSCSDYTIDQPLTLNALDSPTINELDYFFGSIGEGVEKSVQLP